MSLSVKQILEDIGWPTGYHLPAANEDNLKLEAELQRLTLAKAKVNRTYENLNTKCEALTKYSKHLKNEHEENQKLLIVRHSQLETEKKLYTLVKLEREHLVTNSKTIRKEINKIDVRKQIKRTELNNVLEKLNTLKISIEWDEDTIENWEKILLKKQEDNVIIQRFSKEDEKKVKDLQVKKQRLQEKLHSKKQLFIRTQNDLDSEESVLARNLQLYRQLYDERNTLIGQWQDAVKQLQQRDNDILLINHEILDLKELNVKKLELLENEQQFLKNEINNNKQLELLTRANNTEITKLRNEFNERLRFSCEYSINLNGTRIELKKSAELLQNERLKMKKINLDYSQYENILADFLLKVKHLQIQFHSVNATHLTASDRRITLEKIMHTEENNGNKLKTNMKHMQEVLFRSQRTLDEMSELWKLKLLEIHRYEQQIKSIQKQIQFENRELLNVKEKLFKLNFRLNATELKVDRLSGALRDSNEKEILEQFTKLEKTNGELLELNKLLQNQVDKSKGIVHELNERISVDNNEFLKMKNKLQEQILLVDGASKQVAQRKNHIQQLQVQENVIKVKLKYALKTLQQEGISIYNLQRQQIELESMLKERQTEIDINKQLLITKRNVLNKELNQLKRDLQTHRIKVENLMKRYDSALASIGQTEDGEMMSVAYFKVKHAQEKYMLQQEGDKLDQQIRKAEEEIIALENTLKAVCKSNETLKQSLSTIGNIEHETNELKQVEDQLHNKLITLRLNRNHFSQLQEKLQQLQNESDTKKETIKKLENNFSNKQIECKELDKESQDRSVKLIRAEKLIKKVLNTKLLNEKQKKDFLTRQLKDYNKSVIQKLAEISARNMETTPVINRYLSERNLSLPVSSLSNRSNSCSSMSRSSNGSKVSSK